MTGDYLNRARKYLKFEQNLEHKNYVQKLLDDNKDEELRALFGHRLAFGTAGIRGRMGPGYGQMNNLVIIQTSQGLASYLVECHGEKLCKERGVIIGHDARHNSARFSRLAALAFLELGIPVYYCDQIIPTPLIAFGVNLFNCLAGIMVTASHNPKQDNGYKVYWSNGAQILSPHDRNIQLSIERPENQKPWPRAWLEEYLRPPPAPPSLCQSNVGATEQQQGEPGQKQQQQEQQQPPPLPLAPNLPPEFQGLVYHIHGELTRSYLAYIRQLVGERQTTNSSSALRIAYSAMHGVGHTYMSRALRIAGFAHIHPVEAQKKPDPEFPTVKFPNPEEAGALDLAFATAESTNSELVLACDPDADRCAAALFDPATKRRRVLTGNEIGALLGWWAWFCYQRHPVTRRSSVEESSSSSDGPSATASASHRAPMSPPPAPRSPAAASRVRVLPRKPEDCFMLSTAVSSRFLRSMARVEGFQFVETLTGFKHMGNLAHELIHKRNKTVLFAFEEAIGYMVDPQILDKDGVSACVQLAQCAVHLRTAHRRTLEQQLDWLYTRYGYHYSLNSYFVCQEPRTIASIFHHLQTDYPKWFGCSPEHPQEFIVARIRDLNNGIDNGTHDHRATLPTSSSSFMTTFFIDSDIQFTIRTSGTEPKIKYYSEIVANLAGAAPDESAAKGVGPKEEEEEQEQGLASRDLEEAHERAKREAQVRLKRLVDAAIERCLKPAHYKLEPAARHP